MSNTPCRDCSCETIYRKIELPKTYQFGVNSTEYIQYYVPIGDYAAVAGADYFETFAEMQTDYDSTALVATLSTKSFGGGTGFKAIHDTIGVAVTYIDAFDFTFSGTYPANTYYFVLINIINPDFGKTLQYDPAVLSWPINQNVTCYDELKDPFWKLKFPICGTDGKKDKDSTFKLKDCGKWQVEYRLRLRPLIFFGWPEDGDSCKDHWLASGEEVDNAENRTKMWNAYRFYSSMKEQAGAKYLGMTKLRLETGIFNEDSQTEKPIVWSAGKYPQPVIKYKDYWDSNFEDGNYLYNKDCTPVQWDGMHPHLISSDMSEEEFEYKQFKYSYSDIVQPGMFSVETNDTTVPLKIKISKKSQFKGGDYDSSTIPQKYLLEDPEKWLGDCVKPLFASASGFIEIIQRGLINGTWKKLRKINYRVYSRIDAFEETDTSFNFNVQNAYSIINYDVPNLESTTEYYNGTAIKTKYEILIGIKKVKKSVPKMVYGDIQIGNMTELVDDFVYELEGFTHVDMDKEGEISIYLKALPDSPSGHPLEHDTGFVEPFISNFQALNGPADPAVVNESSTMPEKYWPWGVLSADERTGYTEQNKKVYEPLLPVRPDLIDFDTKIFNSIDAGRAYRWGHTLSDTNWLGRKNPNWHIMIEEGWVRLTKTCENCCD